MTSKVTYGITTVGPLTNGNMREERLIYQQRHCLHDGTQQLIKAHFCANAVNAMT